MVHKVVPQDLRVTSPLRPPQSRSASLWSSSAKTSQGAFETAKSVVFQGSKKETVTLSFLEDDIIHVHHAPRKNDVVFDSRTWAVKPDTPSGYPDGGFPRQGRLRNSRDGFTNPAVTVESKPPPLSPVHNEWNLCTVTGDRLRVRTVGTDNGFSFQFDHRDERGEWSEFMSEHATLSHSYDVKGSKVWHYLNRKDTEVYLGLGESSGVLNKQGARVHLRPSDAMGYNAETSDPLYKHIPFYITYDTEKSVAYGLFYDSMAESVIDLGKELSAFRGPYRYYQAEHGVLSCYVIYGPTIKDVVRRYAWLTGYACLPPRYSLGYLGSTMTYTESATAQADLRQFAQLCSGHKTPCSMFHLSSGYTSDAQGQRQVFNWNNDRIPDPEGMTADFHNQDIYLAANIKPHMLFSNPHYESAKGQKVFLTRDSKHPEVGWFWSGGRGEQALGSYFDFLSHAGYNEWKRLATEQLLEKGIDVLWNDNNEYEIDNDEVNSHGFGTRIAISLSRPLQSLLMAQASFEAIAEHKPGKRPYVLTRSGSAGIQRYAQTWSGDNRTSWHTLKYNTPMGLSLSMSGVSNTGHDIGGFAGPKPSPELFARWVQLGIFWPRFCIHSWNSDETVNEPWMYPEILPNIQEVLNLRYSIVPYLYTLMYNHTVHGDPIMRPVIYEFPEDPLTHNESFQYMLGDALMIAPIDTPNCTTSDIHLPTSLEWFDMYTGKAVHGGTLSRDVDSRYIPAFCASNAIIPLYLGHQGKTDPNVSAQRHVTVYPASGEYTRVFEWFEDDGATASFRDPQHRVIVTITVTTTAETIIVSVKANGLYWSDAYGSRVDTLHVYMPEALLNGRRVEVVVGSSGQRACVEPDVTPDSDPYANVVYLNQGPRRQFAIRLPRH